MKEEQIELSQRKRERLKVLHEVQRGHLRQREAAEWLWHSVRQVRRRYGDFGPTLACEHLARQGLAVSRRRAVGCSAVLCRFKHSDGFACHKAVQHVRVKIDFIRPYDRARFGINLDLSEETDVLQRPEYAPSTDNALFEV